MRYSRAAPRTSRYDVSVHILLRTTELAGYRCICNGSFQERQRRDMRQENFLFTDVINTGGVLLARGRSNALDTLELGTPRIAGT